MAGVNTFYFEFWPPHSVIPSSYEWLDCLLGPPNPLVVSLSVYPIH